MALSGRQWFFSTASSRKQDKADLPTTGNPIIFSAMLQLPQSSVPTTDTCRTSWMTSTKTAHLTGRTHQMVQIDPKRQCCRSNDPVSNDQGKTDTLNELFNDAFTSENFDTLPILDHSPFPGIRNITFTISRIRKLLKNIKRYNAAGPDDLSSHLLKDLTPQLSCSICIMFQQCYDTGAIPQAWRDTLVSPIHKGIQTRSRNPPAVSLTSIICKLQEHSIVSSMLTHLEDHGILNPDQHGFRICLFTETQLIQAVHDWASTNDAKGQTDVLFLDFSKAFDTVPLRRLLQNYNTYWWQG